RLAAVGRIRDISSLDKVYEKSRSSQQKIAVIRAMGMMAKAADRILTKLAMEEDDMEARIEAVGHMRDQHLLCSIIKSSEDCKIRTAAVSGIRDEDVLKEIAASDRDIDVRAGAVARIKDRIFLENLAAGDAEYAVRKHAMLALHGLKSSHELIATVVQPAYLADIAKSDHDVKLALPALGRISDRLTLFEIAVSGSEWEVRRAAILAFTAKTNLDHSLDVLMKDASHPIHRKIFQDIIDHEENWRICEKAVSGIEDRSAFDKVERDLSSCEISVVFRLLQESLYARRFLIQIRKSGFSGAVETSSGFESTGREGQLRFEVLNQYIFRCQYSFTGGDKIQLVEATKDRAGKLVDKASVYSQLRKHLHRAVIELSGHNV
ncbi:MAG: hypothetical protein PHQ23_14015, partial [Candidatus Wallbacteria bacterium]|nr:hypothetical protein [Candidatus Wallbacteria bacterium]